MPQWHGRLSSRADIAFIVMMAIVDVGLMGGWGRLYFRAMRMGDVIFCWEHDTL